MNSVLKYIYTKPYHEVNDFGDTNFIWYFTVKAYWFFLFLYE